MAKGEASLLIRIKQAGSGILDDIREKFGSLQNVALTALAAIGAGIAYSLREYAEKERAINSLNTAMVQAGIYTKELSDKYIAEADALSKVTNFGDEEIISAQARLQSYLGNIQVTKELTQATLDLATKTGSLDSAAEAIGKTVASNTNMLARHGFEVDSNASKQEKLQQAIDAVNSRLAGQSQAQVAGLGVYSLLTKAVGDLAEQMGEKLAPIFIVIGNQMKDLVEKYGPPLIDFFGRALNGAISGITATITGVQYVVESLGASIGTTLGFVYEASAAVLSGQFSKLKNLSATFMRDLGEEQSIILEENNKRLSDIGDAFLGDQSAKNDAARQKELEAQKRALELANEEKLNSEIERLENQASINELEMAQIGANDAQLLALKIKALDDKIKAETNAEEKLRLLKEKSKLQDEQRGLKLKEYNDKLHAEQLRGYATFFDGIAALQSSSSKTIGKIAKASAIAKATIDAYLAIQNALSTVPYPANIPAAAGIAVKAFANVANIAGVQLAEGGIVKATNGGIQATIGEGGKDEAVIPLDDPDAQARLGGGGVTINLNGPFMGDESQAREFAVAIDRQLLKLRQSNSSLAFEGDLA